VDACLRDRGVGCPRRRPAGGSRRGATEPRFDSAVPVSHVGRARTPAQGENPIATPCEAPTSSRSAPPNLTGSRVIALACRASLD
jgi:hypothetical protein